MRSVTIRRSVRVLAAASMAVLMLAVLVGSFGHVPLGGFRPWLPCALASAFAGMC